MIGFLLAVSTAAYQGGLAADNDVQFRGSYPKGTEAIVVDHAGMIDEPAFVEGARTNQLAPGDLMAVMHFPDDTFRCDGNPIGLANPPRQRYGWADAASLWCDGCDETACTLKCRDDTTCKFALMHKNAYLDYPARGHNPHGLDEVTRCYGLTACDSNSSQPGRFTPPNEWKVWEKVPECVDGAPISEKCACGSTECTKGKRCLSDVCASFTFGSCLKTTGIDRPCEDPAKTEADGFFYYYYNGCKRSCTEGVNEESCKCGKTAQCDAKQTCSFLKEDGNCDSDQNGDCTGPPGGASTYTMIGNGYCEGGYNYEKDGVTLNDCKQYCTASGCLGISRNTAAEGNGKCQTHQGSAPEPTGWTKNGNEIVTAITEFQGASFGHYRCWVRDATGNGR